jgi:GNAT superfamily N-acetyltransferase
MDVGLAREVEAHEAKAWSACVAATAEAHGNPLLASVDVVAGVPVPALGAVDFGLFNRVIGLGVDVPVTDALVGGIAASYADRAQTSYVLEVTPVTEPGDAAARLEARGLVDTGSRQAKCWQEPVFYDEDGMDVVSVLGPDDADEFAQVNMLAWGTPPFLAIWFGATLFADSFRHFGVRVDGRLVATGAMYVSDGLAWLGFGATLPEHQGRGMQTALLARRIHEAAVLGCRWVHTETAAHTPEQHNPSLSNMLRTGFDNPYDKEWWSPPTPVD